jgi:hypothetical protein
MATVDKDEVLYDCAKSFTIWETFWFYVWSFSMFASYFCSFCYKVCNLVQTLVETQFVQSHKKLHHIVLQTQIWPKIPMNFCVPKTYSWKHAWKQNVHCCLLSRFHSTCTHFQIVAIDPLNVLVASSNKQTLVFHYAWMFLGMHWR